MKKKGTVGGTTAKEYYGVSPIVDKDFWTSGSTTTIGTGGFSVFGIPATQTLEITGYRDGKSTLETLDLIPKDGLVIIEPGFTVTRIKLK